MVVVGGKWRTTRTKDKRNMKWKPGPHRDDIQGSGLRVNFLVRV